jgi:hypothetical protein
MPQNLLTGQLKEMPTYRVWCFYSSFVHGWDSWESPYRRTSCTCRTLSPFLFSILEFVGLTVRLLLGGGTSNLCASGDGTIEFIPKGVVNRKKPPTEKAGGTAHP